MYRYNVVDKVEQCKGGDNIEEWKNIEGYEGIYQVSNLGRVKSLNYNHTKKEKILKLQLHGTGYLLVVLYKESKGKIYQVHRLVAQAFIPNLENKPQVNHKDEDKTNNKVENLEWTTRKENCNYRTRNERIAKSLSKPIYGINIKTNEKIKFSSTQEAGRNGYTQSAIVNCLKGKRKSHKGYQWFYK